MCLSPFSSYNHSKCVLAKKIESAAEWPQNGHDNLERYKAKCTLYAELLSGSSKFHSVLLYYHSFSR